MDAGPAGVLAMRYVVFVETGARLMADVYQRLAQGDTLGEAVSFGRKQLHAQPLRGIGFDPVPLRDWAVPVVFEAAPTALFPKAKKSGLHLRAPDQGVEVEGLPPRPDAGFFGRDETLLALDRAFDRQRIVLLHAYAGSGKTTAAAEFARWYRETGGIAGPVLFTSFAQHKPLARVLDQVGTAFVKALEQAGVHWLTLEDAQRREIALQVLRQVPVLWIWDNVEPVAGFPKGTESKWTAEEQRELADFLRAARETKARFLLTSRRDERGWLGDLPVRIALPRMPFLERLEMARGLAEKANRRITDVEDWRPLLEFTQGNPLAITVLVGQALRGGLRTREQVEAFVERLSAGEAAFTDEASEGRTRSLAASLNYGFEHAFNETERRQLSLLYLFQGFVNVVALELMSTPDMEWSLPELCGLTPKDSIRLLDRAAEIGLLTAHGGGYYSVHPAVPWFFRRRFEERDEEAREHAVHAYVDAIGAMGSYYHDQYGVGNRGVIGWLRADEPNLLNARVLARRNGWWRRVTGAMQGLRQLYEHSGRLTEWARLVNEIVPDFVDPATEGPLPGREEQWNLVANYRVRLARQARQWSEAERMQKVAVEWDRKRVRENDPNSARTLAVSLNELGDIQQEMGRADCVTPYRESYELSEKIDPAGAAVVALNLGNAHLGSDLSEAERWYRRSLDLMPQGDRMGRAASLGQLGAVAYEHFCVGARNGRPLAELGPHLKNAIEFYDQALQLTPADAVGQLATIHHQLGNVLGDAEQLDRALHHYRESIRHQEAAGDLYGSAETRRSVAVTLAKAGRFADAMEYAKAALRNYQTFGASAADVVQKALDLIARIDKASQKLQ